MPSSAGVPALELSERLLRIVLRHLHRGNHQRRQVVPLQHIPGLGPLQPRGRQQAQTDSPFEFGATQCRLIFWTFSQKLDLLKNQETRLFSKTRLQNSKNSIFVLHISGIFHQK